MKKKSNEVITDHWDWLEIDISVPSHPNAVMLISAVDWQYLKSKQEDGAVGRIRATKWNSFSKAYPAARLRGKNRAVLQVLFGQTLKQVRCDTDNWCDVRRESLAHGDGQLKNLGEHGFKKVERVEMRAGGRPKEGNTVIQVGSDYVVLDVATRKYAEAQVTISSFDKSVLEESCAGRISMKAVMGGKSMPYLRIPETLGPDGQPDPETEWKRLPLHTAIHGEELTFATDDYTDVRISNMRKKLKRPTTGEKR